MSLSHLDSADGRNGSTWPWPWARPGPLVSWMTSRDDLEARVTIQLLLITDEPEGHQLVQHTSHNAAGRHRRSVSFGPTWISEVHQTDFSEEREEARRAALGDEERRQAMKDAQRKAIRARIEQ